MASAVCGVHICWRAIGFVTAIVSAAADRHGHNGIQGLYGPAGPITSKGRRSGAPYYSAEELGIRTRITTYLSVSSTPGSLARLERQ
jgi:hypothetical protein